MAERVDSMSDAELRTTLTEYGFPFMPITASTRKTLVNVLKFLLDNKGAHRNGSASSDARRSLGGYPSRKDSDLDADAGAARQGRRASTGGAVPPPPAARARRATPKKDSPKKAPVEQERDLESEEEWRPIKHREEVETVTTRRVARVYKPSDETGSDVDGDNRNSSLRNDSHSGDYGKKPYISESEHMSATGEESLGSDLVLLAVVAFFAFILYWYFYTFNYKSDVATLID